MDAKLEKRGFYVDDKDLLRFALPLFIDDLKKEIPYIKEPEFKANVQGLVGFVQDAIVSIDSSGGAGIKLDIAEMQAMYWAIDHLIEVEKYDKFDEEHARALLRVLLLNLLDAGIDMREQEL